MNRRSFFRTTASVAASGALGHSVLTTSLGAGRCDAAQDRPNIVWFVVEDFSCDFGYQGQPLVRTPHVDRLASEGAIFQNAYVTAPVCSASRSALITGMYQTAIGAHHHRSSRGTVKHHLPSHVKLVPELFANAGYYTCNTDEKYERLGKTDYNFEFNNRALYASPDWSGREPGQPFFAQIQLRGGKLRNVPQWHEEVESGLDALIAPEQVVLPPYYPDDPVFRNDWAQYLNSVQYTDKEVGRVLQRLREENLLNSTVIFFMTDHGISQARGKQFLYDEGAKIPFVVWAPDRIEAGSVREEPIAHIDAVATALYFAGIDIPEYMQARPLWGPQARPRECVVSARDRCDETVDRIRSVRKGDYKYIRNFYPQRPYLQPCAYKDEYSFMKTLRALHAEGNLNKVQALHLAESRPEEELYDLSRDQWEVHNLAAHPEHQESLKELRAILCNWIIESDDRGRFPESEAMYDSDMKAYIEQQMRAGRTEYAQEVQDNVRLMKQWNAEGK